MDISGDGTVPADILAALGWQESSTAVEGKPLTTASSNRGYFYHRNRREVAWDLPYYELLGLPPNRYKELTKVEISKAYFARRMMYTNAPEKCKEEEGYLKDPGSERDWRMIVEAFKTLINPAERTAYEQRNLTPTAQRQLCSLLQMHRSTRDPALL